MRKLESKGELIFLKPIKTFTKEGLENAFKLYEIKPKESVILLDASGGGSNTAKMLAKRGVRTIVTRTSMAHHVRETFTKHEISIVPADKIEIERLEMIVKEYRREREERAP